MRAKEHIDSVLDMYCQIDDLEQFAKFSQQIDIQEERVAQLFKRGLCNDSMKVSLHLALNYSIKYDADIVTALFSSFEETPHWYLEMKLFFI